MTRDLMHSSEIKEIGRDAYGAIDSSTEAVAEKLYSLAEIEHGETILDLGCGAGIDVILAAHRTGPSGRVIGLDFLPEMLEQTASAAAEVGLGNVEILEAEMEAIPLPDASVDHVISNGVINLVPRKRRVLAECARVLVPGGKFSVSDLTVGDEELPPEVLTHPATWAG